MLIDFYSKLVNASGVYTFRDFVLLPGRSDVEPSSVDLSINLTSSIKLNLPLVSSPMDTVTEADMAIALARQGGIGIIHRNMPIEEQVENAKRVKRAESFIIRDVVTISPTDRVAQAIELMQKKSISGLPVVENGDKLIGILTRRDVNFAEQSDLVRDVMTSDVKVAGPEVTIDEAKRIMHRNRVEKLPVVDANRKLLGLITIKDIYSREKFSVASRDDEGRLLVGAAVSPFDLERAKSLEKYVDVLVSDVAHFHNTNILQAAKKMTSEVSTPFIAGNIGTSEGTRDTIAALDGKLAAIRAGVGSGSICVTSEVTKAGAPTLFAVAQIAAAFQEAGLNVPIIADGGIRAAGDAALALAAGASVVMMGNVFAGCTESPGGLIKIGGKYYKPYRGMGSSASRQKRFAMDRYNQPSKGIAEGVEGVVPYRGDVQTVVEEFTSGLRASFGYAGALSIKDLWQKARFGSVSAAGVEELRPHNIILPGEEKI
ncbi:MAG TPA: IMP dehydrogenase [Nitrososphaerales archaeon]|nr:IMP dehydrogenase [Nitrososphaerales archaeon]